MRDFVIKKVRFDSEETWGANSGSFYAVKIDHCEHTMEFESLGGAAPDFEAFKNFCLADRDIVKELKWALTEYHRKFPVFIKHREGMSGCHDISLFLSRPQHDWAYGVNAEKLLHLHISCMGKLNEGIPDMFSGDLLEVLYYADNSIVERLGAEKRTFFKYLRKNDFSQMERINSICGSM